ncbi:MAG: RluA family pseudouridine synthase [Christensenellaceae bacterium]|nr:RluA family pseudouridine synthase [Christensenellaceae bacterium]
MRTISFTIPPECEGITVRSILKNQMRLSSGLIARIKLIQGGILLNGAPVHTNVRVQAGDVLCATVGPSGTSDLNAVVTHGAERKAFPYEILFEDEDILIINKPAGVAAHGSRYDACVPSIGKAVGEYYGNDEMYHPVSRLDKGTTGVMTIAKNGFMHELLITALHSDEFRRVYIGIAEGDVGRSKGDFGTIDLPIGRADGSAIKREVRRDGARAVTHYEVIGYENGYSIVGFVLETGRTHQIRVHMAAIGHPLVGDWLYGTERKDLIERPALHSKELEFIHPLTGERHIINAKLPQDMRELVGWQG